MLLLPPHAPCPSPFSCIFPCREIAPLVSQSPKSENSSPFSELPPVHNPWVLSTLPLYDVWNQFWVFFFPSAPTDSHLALVLLNLQLLSGVSGTTCFYFSSHTGSSTWTNDLSFIFNDQQKHCFFQKVLSHIQSITHPSSPARLCTS